MGDFLGSISDIFGYVLNWIYNIVGNYGVALILFTILVKAVILPITIKQQKTMKKTSKIQEEVKKIQFKYKGNQEKINQETIELYKREKMSPCSGCFSGIIQILLLLSVFYLVSQPLTHMRRVDTQLVQEYITELKETTNQDMMYPQMVVIREKGQVDDRVKLNMNFLGLDLSSVPKSEMNNFKVYIIPAIYVITSVISIRLTTKNNIKKKETEVKENAEGEESEVDLATQMNKNMTFMMPIMSVMIAFVAPLGLALYWLVNNILTIGERIVIDKYIIKDEEKEEPKEV